MANQMLRATSLEDKLRRADLKGKIIARTMEREKAERGPKHQEGCLKHDHEIGWIQCHGRCRRCRGCTMGEEECDHFNPSGGPKHPTADNMQSIPPCRCKAKAAAAKKKKAKEKEQSEQRQRQMGAGKGKKMAAGGDGDEALSVVTILGATGAVLVGIVLAGALYVKCGSTEAPPTKRVSTDGSRELNIQMKNSMAGSVARA